VKIPQYRINVHLASILGELGFPIRAEEAKERAIPDFVIMHHKVGIMLGEAEIAKDDNCYDPSAMAKLEDTANSRFENKVFEGIDFLALLIYPRGVVNELESIVTEDEFRRKLREASIGLGLAVRPYTFLEPKPSFKWYNRPVKVVELPTVLDQMIDDYLRVAFKSDFTDVVTRLMNIIENSSKELRAVVPRHDNPQLPDSVNEWLTKLRDVAVRLQIDWDSIKKLEDRVELTAKSLLLISALLMIGYELARIRHPEILKNLDCNSLTPSGLGDYLDSLLHVNYKELDGELVDILHDVPDQPILEQALKALCQTVKRHFGLLRKGGWDFLAMLYQRLLSETYRHGYATFYTKIQSARLLAGLAIESFEDSVVDPACGTGSLLLSSFIRRKMLLPEKLSDLIREALEKNQPLLYYVNRILLEKTVGLDALRPAIYLTALNLIIASEAIEHDRLKLYPVSVGKDKSGSLDLLIAGDELPSDLKRLLGERFDVVIMNPPFTRSDRIPSLIGEVARKRLSAGGLAFGGVELIDVLKGGLAKPFLSLADLLVKDGGRIAAVLPNSVLSRPTYEDIRKGLLKSYTPEFIIVSWARGSPNFSSDTEFREILMVARKGHVSKPLVIINLLKGVDDLTLGEIEAVIVQAKKCAEYGTSSTVVVNNESIAYLMPIRQDLVTKYSDNLYRFIAFREKALLEWHLTLLSSCKTTRLGDLFTVGSVVDHTGKGIITPYRRGSSPSGLLHVTPAIWGSGSKLGIRSPLINKSPYEVGVRGDVTTPNGLSKYWSSQEYFSDLFILRRGRLATQYVLAIRTNEPSISNVWWPIKPKENVDFNPFLAFFNSTFGFIHMLGERLETEGLFVEYKKDQLENMRVPDFRKVPSEGLSDILTQPMPTFSEYLRYMASIQKKTSENWIIVAESVVKRNNEYSPRAQLDLYVFQMLTAICQTIEPPGDLYSILWNEVQTLSEIMDTRDDENKTKIEDVEEKIKKSLKEDKRSAKLTDFFL